MNKREEAYLKFFTDGNVSLDYLKKIVVRDRILKSEKGKMLDMFPNFLMFEEDYTEDIYDSNYFMLPAKDIRTALTNTISLIENVIFAQDIPLLNNIASKFEKSFNINTASRNKLLEEQAKLKEIRTQLESNIAEAKKVFTAYDAIINGFADRKDPVLAYTEEMQAKIEQKINADKNYQAEQARQIELKRIADEQALILAQKLKEQKELNEAKLAEELKQAEIANQKALEESRIVTQASKDAFLTPSSQPTVTTQTKSSPVVPLLLGAGVLAAIFLGGNNE